MNILFPNSLFVLLISGARSPEDWAGLLKVTCLAWHEAENLLMSRVVSDCSKSFAVFSGVNEPFCTFCVKLAVSGVGLGEYETFLTSGLYAFNTLGEANLIRGVHIFWICGLYLLNCSNPGSLFLSIIKILSPYY